MKKKEEKKVQDKKSNTQNMKKKINLLLVRNCMTLYQHLILQCVCQNQKKMFW